jgi:hypothetical protein
VLWSHGDSPQSSQAVCDHMANELQTLITDFAGRIAAIVEE